MAVGGLIVVVAVCSVVVCSGGVFVVVGGDGVTVTKLD